MDGGTLHNGIRRAVAPAQSVARSSPDPSGQLIVHVDSAGRRALRGSVHAPLDVHRR